MSVPIDQQRIAANVAQVRHRVACAAESVGRRGDEVQLVAVTKYVELDGVEAVLRAGCTALGESRPQQLEARAVDLARLGRSVQWHLVGHLQRNKIRRVLPHAALLHSVDSERLLDAIDRVAAEEGLHVRVLLEANISGDPQKHGLSPDEVRRLLEHRGPCLAHTEIVGLMGMSGLTADANAAREQFASLRELREAIGLPEVRELSMGMSGDFEMAIAEGATIVRVGSALFA